MPKHPVPYQVASAMRGPDNSTDYALVLKKEITARIRAAYYRENEVFGYFISRCMNEVEYQSCVQAIKRLSGDSSQRHYLRHLFDAMAASRKAGAILKPRFGKHFTPLMNELSKVYS